MTVQTLPSPAVAAKAAKILTDGRLRIKEAHQGFVLAHVRGDTALRGVGWTADRGYVCTCESRVWCSHREALRLCTHCGEEDWHE